MSQTSDDQHDLGPGTCADEAEGASLESASQTPVGVDAGRRDDADSEQKGGNATMPDELRQLLELAKTAPMTTDEREQQRRSFAFGNTNIENERVTRETIEREAEAMKRDDQRK